MFTNLKHTIRFTTPALISKREHRNYNITTRNDPASEMQATGTSSNGMQTESLHRAQLSSPFNK